MKKHKIIKLNRKWHRYLGASLGVQFLLWTLGGLYFSWTNIDEIRGDDLKQQQILALLPHEMVSPAEVLKSKDVPTDSIVSLELVTILGEPLYRVTYKENKVQVKLFNAGTGNLKKPLTEQESVQLAKERLNVSAEITDVEYLTESGKHHEYRGKPLPAYAITFDEPANTTIYVSPHNAKVETFRSNEWRVFDFLWMLHTMDYVGRDNFNNILLRAFALFGLVTILSGFSLYIFTSRIFKKRLQ